MADHTPPPNPNTLNTRALISQIHRAKVHALKRQALREQLHFNKKKQDIVRGDDGDKVVVSTSNRVKSNISSTPAANIIVPPLISGGEGKGCNACWDRRVECNEAKSICARCSALQGGDEEYVCFYGDRPNFSEVCGRSRRPPVYAGEIGMGTYSVDSKTALSTKSTRAGSVIAPDTGDGSPPVSDIGRTSSDIYEYPGEIYEAQDVSNALIPIEHNINNEATPTTSNVYTSHAPRMSQFVLPVRSRGTDVHQSDGLWRNVLE